MEVIFSDSFWRRRYGGDPGVIGRHVTLDGISYEVVGVTPAGFPLAEQYDLWAPSADGFRLWHGTAIPHAASLRQVEGRRWRGAGAGRSGRVGCGLEQRYPNDKGYGLKIETFLDHEVGGIRKTLWIFAAAVGACC